VSSANWVAGADDLTRWTASRQKTEDRLVYDNNTIIESTEILLMYCTEGAMEPKYKNEAKSFSLVSVIPGGDPVVGRPTAKIGMINGISLVVAIIRSPTRQNGVQLGPR
jgi:hypothetical protein